VHAVEGGAAGTVNVDGVSTGASMSFLGNSGYADVASGSRSLSFGGAAATVTAFRSEEQSSVVIYMAGTTTAYLNLAEGHMGKNNASATAAKVKFVHVASGSSADIVIRQDSATAANLATIPFASVQQYMERAPGSATFFAVSTGNYKATIDGSQEPTPVPTSSTGSATATLNATTLSYNITVDVDSITGFYTAAHFHNAAAGVNGPVVRAIFTDTTGQRITIPNAALSGANEPTPVTTASLGTGRFILSPQGLTYSISVTPGAPDTLGFTMAHFHNAAAGANGPVVRTIAGPVTGDSTLTGVWRTDDLVEPLTPALMTELVNGRIYVNFHSAAAPGGTIRAQVVPDKRVAFIGTWGDSTLTEALKTEFNNGNIYVNFHTTDYPGGKIRGQVQVDGAKYAVASLPATSFEVGKMYTIVATGSGTTFQLTTLDDRLGAGAPIGKPQVASTRK
jgi:hypothetical protein